MTRKPYLYVLQNDQKSYISHSSQFQRIQNEEHFPNSFCEVVMILMSKLGQNSTKKEKLAANLTYEQEHKYPK